MSSAVVSTSAALRRPFVFADEAETEVCLEQVCPEQFGLEQSRSVFGAKKPSSAESAVAQIVQSAIQNRKSAIPLTSASRLEIRPAPEMVSSGITELDALTGGLPRGCLTEICGPASSGRTTVMLAALAAATRRGEYCALIDASDALDPQSVAAAGIDLDRLLWVRCGESSPQRHRSTEKQNQKERIQPYRESQSEHRLEQVLRATDLLLESGGFGLIVLDLADLLPQAARRIPLTTWFRFRRAVENKPTILLAIEQQPIAGSCSSLLLQLAVLSSQLSVPSSKEILGNQVAARQEATQDLPPSHAHLLTGIEINAELVRSRLERKPARSVIFETKTAWAG
jgi:hypothetical protein